MKRVLITGASSYIGMSVEKWLIKPEFAGMYQVDTVDMRGNAWKEKDFSGYDTVFHVAGIAHADVGKVTEAQKELYYKVNCDLAVETAEKAKREGTKQFIYMSSIIVYGEGTSVRKKRVITKQTNPAPSNFYGDSKWRAEQKLTLLNDDVFHVAILRPPMIYGESCKGNYLVLSKVATTLPIFPNINHERSMLYIGNFCEFFRLLTESVEGGIYFPQNSEYVKISEMAKKIAEVHKKCIWVSSIINFVVYILGLFPGKIGLTTMKAFGELVYEKDLSKFKKGNYCIYGLAESIKKTEAQNLVKMEGKKIC